MDEFCCPTVNSNDKSDLELSYIAISENYRDEVRKNAEKVLQSRYGVKRQQMDVNNAELKKLKEKSLRLLNHYEDKLIDRDELLQRKADYARRIERLEVEYFANLYVPIKSSEEFLNLTAIKGKLDYHWTPTGQYLLNLADRPEWCKRRDLSHCFAPLLFRLL